MASELLSLPDAVEGVPLLRERRIAKGERWILSAGFNVASHLPDTSRLDSEVSDLCFLVEQGARVALLSHQGSSRDDSAAHIEYAADYLAGVLGTRVFYFPQNATAAAEQRARRMTAGEIVVFGNTRHNPGEERNDPQLAGRFSRLGDAAAIGGFSKAHRLHASNAGVLAHLPAYAADSLVREMALLGPWASIVRDRPSLAVLGGVKDEKTLVALRRMAETYDDILPGGAVLGSLLAAAGIEIGDTVHGGPACVTAAAEVLGRPTRANIHLPDTVVAARLGAPAERCHIRLPDPVPSGYAIVDFALSAPARAALGRLPKAGGRAVVAGTPTLYSAGFREGTDAILAALAAPGCEAILLGGDTVAELPWSGATSPGGGSALHYIATGTLPVIQALKEQ